MSKCLLTISLLISKRPDTVRKCLDSIQPLLRAIPSELILTDTGCGEEVRTIIEEYTDHIIDFEWCKDFSKARNAGLKQAKGEWFLFLDDDEWFENTDEMIEFFRSGEYQNYGLAAYIQRNYLDRTGTVYTDLPVGRMIRLEPDVEFIYSIHECFNYVPGNVKKFHSYVHHYGYAHRTDADRIAHAMRNIELLTVENENNPRNMKHALQLVKEYNSIQRWEDSLKLSLESIEIAKNGPIEIEFCRDSLYANAVEAYVQLNRKDEAIAAGVRYLEEEELDPLVRAMISGILAGLYYEKSMGEECLKMVFLYAKIYRKYKKDEDAFVKYVTTVNSGCFEQRNRSMVFGSGICAALEKEMYPKALEWFEDMDWEADKMFVRNAMLECVVHKLTELGERAASGKTLTEEMQILFKMCNILFKRKELEEFMAKTILNSCENMDKLKVFAGLQTEHWVGAMIDLSTGSIKEETLWSVLRNMSESMPYIQKFGVLEMLEAEGCDVGELLGQIPYYSWENTMMKYATKAEEEELVWWEQWGSRLPETEDLKRLAWKKCVNYGKLMHFGSMTQKEQEAKEVLRVLWDYGENTRELCEKLYHPETLCRNPDILSEEYQVAYLLADLKRNMEMGRLDEAIETAKAIKECGICWNGIVKFVLLQIQKAASEGENQQAEVMDEMRMLGQQLKLKIRQLMQSGNHREALSVANQVAVMLPDDTELQMLIQELSG